MNQGNLRLRVLTLLIVISLIALTVQSYVGMTISISTAARSYVDDKIDLLTNVVNLHGANIHDGAEKSGYHDTRQLYYGKNIQCLVTGTRDSSTQVSKGCDNISKLEEGIKVALDTNETDVRFDGVVFTLFSFRHTSVIVTVPVIESRLPVKAVSASVSLLPVYESYRGLSSILLIYIILNAVVFTAIGFFRIEVSLIRPIQKLVGIAESYCEDKEIVLYSQRESGPFRVIGNSITTMLNRIQRDNEELEKTVKELRGANEELRESRIQMVQSEKLAAVGRLSAGLAHEIGNPLSIVQGYVDLLKRDEIIVEDRKDFGLKADEELDRIKLLIQEMLHFSKPLKVDREEVHLNSLVAETILMLKMESRVKHCEILSRLEAENDTLFTEKDALKQVIINCVLNAADAIDINTSEDRVISIATKNVELDKKGTTLLITIEDQGKGIKSDDISVVFEPFYTTKEPGKGTGLGLFVSHVLMERMGGVIRLKSKENSGTTVELQFPLNLVSDIKPELKENNG